MKGCLGLIGKGFLTFVFLFVAFAIYSGLNSDVSTSSSGSPSRPLVGSTHHTIKFTSDPPGAAIYLDGESYSLHTTPAEVQLAPGNHTYRVTFEEYEEEFDLYKPYSGKINVTKDDGISVWLDRRSAEEIARREAAEAEAAAAEQVAQEAAIDAQRVYYRIDTNCSSGANLTYFNDEGNITQQSNQGSTWYYGFVPNTGDYLSISAQNQCDYGYITVKLVQDGVTLEENTSSGAYVIASVSGQWE